ncbi:LruC domain-containing protein [Luteibaculum oceani]|uniref:LruC domain-containing protein n=1 Tax=Luteibaculum oceani TaxID=1294296 RepID=A0A5C6UV18_9FLAO|nr:LruC domain-containing protein [Luteibaculum oceani]TXC77117.1 LruC domain-containing protein [Luteibaculum oceani]
MQNSKTIIVSLFSLLCIALSCKKYTVPVDSNRSTNFVDEIRASDDFSWATSKSLNPQITFEGDFATQFLVLEILDKNYNRIQKFFKPSTVSSLRLDKQISARTDSAYLFCNKANIFLPFSTDNENIVVRNSTELSRPLPQPNASESTSSRKSSCNPSNCDRIINSSSGDIIVGKREDICINSSFSGSIKFTDQGSVTICANVALTNLTVNGSKGAIIIINDGGRLSASNLNINEKTKIINHGIVELAANLNLSAEVENYGSWTNSGSLNLNSSGEIQNFANASMSFSGGGNVIGNLSNAGRLIFSGNVNLNNSGKIENFCSLEIAGNLISNGELYNSSYIDITGNCIYNSGSLINFEDKAITHNGSLTINGGKFDMGSGTGVGVFVVANNTTINSGIDIYKGFLDICDNNGIETNNASTADKAQIKECATTVLKDACVLKGIESSTDPDGDDDDDGVSNGNDDKKGDKDVAAIFNYPSTGYAYRAYEDLWPSRGDYDFNDLVLKYKVEFEANSKNEITGANFEITINAIGAGHLNGIGIQFLEKTGDSYTRYAGSIYENLQGASIDGSDPSVALITSNIFEYLGSEVYKNDGQGPDGDPVTINVEIDFTKGAKIDASSVIPDIFMFRFENRGLEVHLPGIPPTNAATSSLFNTKEDQSEIKGWYRTKDNFPWGMEIHGVDGFLHPRSRVAINAAYPEFTNWVNSDGTQNTDWYLNPVIGLVY